MKKLYTIIVFLLLCMSISYAQETHTLKTNIEDVIVYKEGIYDIIDPRSAMVSDYVEAKSKSLICIATKQRSVVNAIWSKTTPNLSINYK